MQCIALVKFEICNIPKKCSNISSHFGYNFPQFGYIPLHGHSDICVMNFAFNNCRNIKTYHNDKQK